MWNMMNLEEYVDYRQFLKDFYEENKKQHSYFSYRYFCRKAGINSPPFYKEVAHGKRNLTDQTVTAFIKGLGLNARQGDFFRELVFFTQAKNAQRKQEHLERMRGLLPRISEKVLPADFYSYYSRWYHIAVRELACMIDWKDDYKVLAASLRPSIKVREARQAIKLLLDLGMIRKGDNGRYEQTARHLTSGPEVVSLSVRQVNEQLSSLGAEAIGRFPASARDVSSLTVGLAPESYGLVKVAIQEFKDKVKRLISLQGTPGAVYNLNVQFFPLSAAEMPKEQQHD
jgi:uncharacterized protein (TIGR02147 family)